MSKKDRFAQQLKDLKSIASIHKRNNSLLQKEVDNNRKELEILFPGLIKDIKEAVIKGDRKLLKDQMEKLRKYKEEEFEKLKNKKSK